MTPHKFDQFALPEHFRVSPVGYVDLKTQCSTRNQARKRARESIVRVFMDINTRHGNLLLYLSDNI